MVTSDQAFRQLWPSFCAAQRESALLADQRSATEAELAKLETKLISLRTRLDETLQQRNHIQQQLEVLKPRLVWCPVLPRDVWLSISSKLPPIVRATANLVCTEFRESITLAGNLGMYKGDTVLCAAVGGDATGQGHTVVCTRKGAYSFGSSLDGRLGHIDGDLEEEEEEQNQHTPRLIASLAGKIVVSVAAGSSHTALCTREGDLYTFGDGMYGQLGHGVEQDLQEPGLVKSLVGCNVMGVAAGEYYTVACSSEGGVFSFGYGIQGQLGLGAAEEWSMVPMLVQGLSEEDVVEVAAGWAHTVARTAHGGVYSFGCGFLGRLGHAQEENEVIPRLVEGLDHVIVASVAAGSTHTVVCTDEGRVWTFGSGDHGQLGHGGQQNELCPRAVASLTSVKAVSISAGGNGGGGHTIVCTSDGQLYTFGYGHSGQLGHGGCENELVPRLVEATLTWKVVGVAAGCSSEHSIAWTEEGRVFGFGDSRNGRLGSGRGFDETGTEDWALSPQTVPKLVSM